MDRNLTGMTEKYRGEGGTFHSTPSQVRNVMINSGRNGIDNCVGKEGVHSVWDEEGSRKNYRAGSREILGRPSYRCSFARFGHNQRFRSSNKPSSKSRGDRKISF